MLWCRRERNLYPDIDPAALQGALQGSAADPDLAPLVAIARDLRRLQPPAPDAAAVVRLRRRFNDVTSGGGTGLFAWFAGWFGLGARPRGLTTRLASGAFAIILIGGGSAASAPPVREVAVRSAQVAENLVVNLDPRRRPVDESVAGTQSQQVPPPAATATPPAAVPGAAVTPSPSSRVDDHGGDDAEHDSHEDDSDQSDREKPKKDGEEAGD